MDFFAKNMKLERNTKLYFTNLNICMHNVHLCRIVDSIKILVFFKLRFFFWLIVTGPMQRKWKIIEVALFNKTLYVLFHYFIKCKKNVFLGS